jgi:hypothetical protein
MKLFQKQLVTGLIIMTGATYAQATTHVPLVFAQTYVSAGAAATFGGHIVATTYFVGGASNTIDGDIKAGAAITLGADNRDPMTCGSNCSTVEGNTVSGTATTLGAGVVVNGNVQHGTALTRGAGATFVSEGPQLGPIPLVHSYNSVEVKTARDFWSALDDYPFSGTVPQTFITNHLESRMDADKTLDPLSSDMDNWYGVDGNGDAKPTKITTTSTIVYNLASLTTAAGITLKLTCGYDYVFDIADMLSLGAGTKIEMTIPMGSPNCSNSVTWNVGGYASVGEDAEMIGNVLAKSYISTGVKSVIKGNLHSETSYVTLGERSTVNPQHQPGS